MKLSALKCPVAIIENPRIPPLVKGFFWHQRYPVWGW